MNEKYFGNLPEPLTLEEEQGLVRKIHGEDTEKGIAARNELVEHNLRWVLGKVNSIGNNLSRDDFLQLRSETIERVLNDAERFEERGVKFISYLATFLPQFLRTCAYKIKQGDVPNVLSRLKLNHNPEYFRPTGKATHAHEEGWSERSWEEMVPFEGLNPEEEYVIKERNEVLKLMLDELPERERLALEYYFLEDVSLEAIGNRLRVTSEMARQIKERGLRKMRHPLRSNYLGPYVDENFKPSMINFRKMRNMVEESRRIASENSPKADPLETLIRKQNIKMDLEDARRNYDALLNIGLTNEQIETHRRLLKIPSRTLNQRYNVLVDDIGIPISFLILNPNLFSKNPKLIRDNIEFLESLGIDYRRWPKSLMTSASMKETNLNWIFESLSDSISAESIIDYVKDHPRVLSATNLHTYSWHGRKGMKNLREKILSYRQI
jgi:RNA polymerase sigma factor (sigma-70 family)